MTVIEAPALLDPARAREAKLAKAAEMATHIQHLCDLYDIEMHHRAQGGYAIRRARIIKVPPIKGATSYFTALHEIGHVVQPGASGGTYCRLTEEGLAWQWAIANTIFVFTPGMKAKVDKWLNNYLLRARRRKGMLTPPEGDIYWVIRQWARGEVTTATALKARPKR